MQKMIAAMYTLHLPQGFIIAMSTTLRYFPALKEEFVHINAAMKLQNISWASRLECTVVPLIVSAVNTSDEIAAAAVARGIENPGKKTSEITHGNFRLVGNDFGNIWNTYSGDCGIKK